MGGSENLLLTLIYIEGLVGFLVLCGGIHAMIEKWKQRQLTKSFKLLTLPNSQMLSR